jgi:protein-tyrosine-phosphatase
MVYFVDALEPSYSRARLARFFLDKVHKSRATGTQLYCFAGGVRPAINEEQDHGVMSVVPGLDATDLQHLSVPPYVVGPEDLESYDVIVAMDEETQSMVTQMFPSSANTDHVCVLDDFLDSCAAPETPFSGSRIVEADGRYRFSSPDDRGCQSEPDEILSGLPTAWKDRLWKRGVGHWCFSPRPPRVRNRSATMVSKSTERVVGRMLRSSVGLERALMDEIPADLRWSSP